MSQGKTKAKRRSLKGRSKRKSQELDVLKQINANAAAVDIGSRSHFVAVPPGRDKQCVREFGVFTADLHHLADWLKRCGVETVAMESTGVYWIPLMEVLEDRGFEVILVDPRQLKNVPGRKSDVLDCQWSQQLHMFGLLSGAFRPNEQICKLRSLIRHRGMLIRYASDHVRHIQKKLTEMNLRLTEVVSDVVGVTGRRIIQAILDGERDPAKLAKLRDGRCKRSEETIAKALEGNWRDDHLLGLRDAVELREEYLRRVAVCDAEIDAYTLSLEDRRDPADLEGPPSPRKRGSNPFAFDGAASLRRLTGVDLTRVEGLAPQVAFQIISEIGLDMGKWPSVDHFGSWLAVCPGSKITGGKQLSSRTRPCVNRAACAFRLAAFGVQHSKGPIGEFYRRMKTRLGAPAAITATAHKIARIVYAMLRDKKEYDPTRVADQVGSKRRALARLKRAARRLGQQLVPLEAKAA